MTDFLTADERTFLIEPKQHETSYLAWRNKHRCKIVVDIDARLLASLAEAALAEAEIKVLRNRWSSELCHLFYQCWQCRLARSRVNK